ncbi:MAG: NADH-quinone oxidoreductase subunit NuoH [Dehalococcoidales bacterium]|nr:NADH-quinone oxidoreductase subunit NuoH [Dehalococcoidales bacterium]
MNVPYSSTLAPDWPGGFWWHWLLFSVLIIVIVFLVLIFVTYAERRVLGFMQARRGPNRTGPFGSLQIVADAVKAMLKEDIIPDRVDKLVFWMAPIVSFFPVLLIFAVIPLNDGVMLADLNVGLLYILAISSISVIGIFMAGWGSNNKYSLLSAMRSIASVVSYEIPVVLSAAGVVMIAGSLSLNQIVMAQNIPFILLQPLGFLLFFIGSCAEISRSPFDLLEADQEIVAGHHTEYSGMKFTMFYLVEYAEALALSAVIATLFLGGWKGPGLPPWLWFAIKVFAVYFVLIWTRATLPRVRIDQLMALAWKFLLPLSIINLFITAIEVLVWTESLPWIAVPINIVIMALLVLLWSRFFKFGWGRVEVGSLR